MNTSIAQLRWFLHTLHQQFSTQVSTSNSRAKTKNTSSFYHSDSDETNTWKKHNLKASNPNAALTYQPFTDAANVWLKRNRPQFWRKTKQRFTGTTHAVKNSIKRRNLEGFYFVRQLSKYIYFFLFSSQPHFASGQPIPPLPWDHAKKPCIDPLKLRLQFEKNSVVPSGKISTYEPAFWPPVWPRTRHRKQPSTRRRLCTRRKVHKYLTAQYACASLTFDDSSSVQSPQRGTRVEK